MLQYWRFKIREAGRSFFYLAADGFGSHCPCPDTWPMHDGFARREI
jgi:hypothetical protein